jgi:hypothetical protein
MEQTARGKPKPFFDPIPVRVAASGMSVKIIAAWLWCG